MSDYRDQISKTVWSEWPKYGKTLLHTDAALGNRSLGAIMGLGSAAMPFLSFKLVDYDLKLNAAVRPPASAQDVIELLVKIFAQTCQAVFDAGGQGHPRVRQQLFPDDPVTRSGAQVVLVSPNCSAWPEEDVDVMVVGSPEFLFTPEDKPEEADFLCLSGLPKAEVWMRMSWDSAGTQWVEFDIKPAAGINSWMVAKYVRSEGALDSLLGEE